MRQLIRASLVALASFEGCQGSSEPLPQVTGTKESAPAVVCAEPPNAEPKSRPRLVANGNPASCLTAAAINHITVDRGTAKGRYTPSRQWLEGQKFPVTLVAPRGRVERLEFYDQCQGISYHPGKETYDCLMREVSAWRYQPDGGCPRTYYYDDSIELTMPRGDQSSVVSSGGCGA